MSSNDVTAVPMADARRLRADRARQVADVLRRQVLHGAFPSGALPAEPQLVKDFGASRNTMPEGKDVKKALYRVLRQRSIKRVGEGTCALRRGGIACLGPRPDD